MFYHAHCGGKHEFVSQARDCETAPSYPQPAPPSVHPNPPLPAKMVTERQLWFIENRLGGDVAYARTLTCKAASEYIETLKRKKESVIEKAPNRTTTKIPMEMLLKIEPGFYAVREDESVPFRFYRISRPKSGKFRGAFKVQSQHSEKYNLVLSVWPSGNLTWYNLLAENDLFIVAVNQKACALAYGQEIGRCCRCNKALTDERSRWYGIGPECEQVWPHILDMVADQKGAYVE